MANLYFMHSNGTQSLVKPNVSHDYLIFEVMKDLKNRNPDFKSHYQRTWDDDKGWTWVDVGSHTEFYLLY